MLLLLFFLYKSLQITSTIALTIEVLSFEQTQHTIQSHTKKMDNINHHYEMDECYVKRHNYEDIDELILEKTSSNRSKDLSSEQSNDSGGDQSKKRSKMLV